MKIEFSEKDNNYINGINKDLSEGKNPPLFINQVGNQYYINFTCLDKAKANAFIINLLHGEGLEEKIGIHVNSINYCSGDSKLAELKNLLQSFLNTLDNI